MADLLDNIGSALKEGASFVEKSLGSYTSNFGGVSPSFVSDTLDGDGIYQVSQLSYPSNLFSSSYEYGGNYVIFYVNVAEDSKLIKEGLEQVVDIAANERLRASINQSGITAEGAVAGSALAGGLGGGLIGTILGGGTGLAAGGAAGAGLAGVAAGVISAVAGGKMSRQQKRLKTAIALNVPNTLNIRYSTNWSEEDTAAFQALAQLGEGGMKAVEEGLKDGSFKTAGASAKDNLTGPASSVAAYVSLSAGGAGLSAASGLAPNPKKEQIFKGVDFRTFVFDYQFAPRNKKEMDNVLKIINTFKYHMHPEFKDSASFVFVYPSEFDIHYYYLNDDNQALHKHTSCVLTDLNINYTPNGAFDTFDDGRPTQINVQMTFKELAFLTKDQIKQGY